MRPLCSRITSLCFLNFVSWIVPWHSMVTWHINIFIQYINCQYCIVYVLGYTIHTHLLTYYTVNIPILIIFVRSQRNRFLWRISCADPSFVICPSSRTDRQVEKSVRASVQPSHQKQTSQAFRHRRLKLRHRPIRARHRSGQPHNRTITNRTQ